MEEKKVLLANIFEGDSERLSGQIIKVTLIYLLLSVSWNIVFYIFELDYSKANLTALILILLFWIALFFIHRYTRLASYVIQQLVLASVLLTMIGLYFGSGFAHSWSYFLLLPIISGLYGKRKLLISYSILGLIVLALLSIFFRLEGYDAIDISNGILLYIVTLTFSALLLQKLFNLYNKQVDVVLNSAEKTIEQVVQSLVVAVEAKDHYTFGHSERVCKYALALAEQIAPYDDIQNKQRLRFSALVHDIGKINIPEHILNKPGPLTKEEYDIIMTHPVSGYKMIEKVEGLGSLKDGVMYHHEHWDGKGYPSGLKGEEIPWDARILAIADAFDSMTSTRSYREAMSAEAAFEQLRACRGTQFDPYLIDKLEKIKGTYFEICVSEKDSVKELERLTDLL